MKKQTLSFIAGAMLLLCTNMVFRKYGERQFLAEVRLVGHGDGFALIKSKAERQLAQAPVE
jgi:hypothetical protein